MRHNLALTQSLAPGSRVLAIIKADGYGHGLEAVAAALSKAPIPADAFGVASIDDALRLRECGNSGRIVLLSGFDEAADLGEIQRLELDCVVHHESQITMLENASPINASVIGANRKLRVWLKLDSGMRRLGFFAQDYFGALTRLQALANVDPAIVLMTHFAQADCVGRITNNANVARAQMEIERAAFAQTHLQMRQFDLVVGGEASADQLPYAHSLANSGALICAPDSHRQWIRPGGILYGLSTHDHLTGAELGFRPAMRLSTKLISVKAIQTGDAVGYGGSFIAAHPMRIGIAAIGYGDGYPRHVPSGTPVIVAGRQTRTVGRVSMDLLTLDLTPFPELEVGAEVVLWGDGLAVETIARAAETIAYELTCGVTKRVRFSYVGDL